MVEETKFKGQFAQGCAYESGQHLDVITIYKMFNKPLLTLSLLLFMSHKEPGRTLVVVDFSGFVYIL